MAEWCDVAPQSELPTGARKVVETDAGALLVFNLADQYYAIEDRCSHDGTEIGSGKCEEDEIICPRHGARFCIRTGESLTPPAYEDLEVFPVRIHEGIVQVDIDG